MKKFFAMILALSMIMAMALPTLATSNNPDDVASGTPVLHTLTISGPAGSTVVHTYQAYQIFAGDLSNEKTILSNIVWGDGVIGDALLEALKKEAYFGEGAANEFSSCTTAQGVADVISKYSTGSAKLDKFAEIVGKNLTTACTESTAGTGNTYVIADLKPGYYLVKDKDNTLNQSLDSYTKFMLHITKDQSVLHKGDVPSVKKEVSDQPTTGYAKYEDAGIGDTVYYKLTGTLPTNYADYETYKYEFHDTLSIGLTYNEIESVSVLHSDKTTTAVAAESYTVENDGQNIAIKFADLKKLTKLASDQIIVVYSAVVNSNATIGAAGNENIVKLIFNNDPNGEGEGKTPDDKTIVFTFELDVYKVDGADTTKMLPGAEFVMFIHGHNDAGETVEKFAIMNDEHEVVGWTTEIDNATTLISDASGKFVVRGVDARTYHLRETKAPNGYNLLTDDVDVTINATYKENQLDTLSVTINGKTQQGNIQTGIVQTGVLNNQGETLPTTGGMGTTLFYTVGGILVAAALILLVTKKRMSAEA